MSVARPGREYEQDAGIADGFDGVALAGIEDRPEARAARDALDVHFAVDHHHVCALVDLVLLFQKRIVAGLTAGAVKG